MYLCKTSMFWDIQKIPLTQLSEAKSTQNQFHFHCWANLGISYRKIYAKISCFSNNSLTNKQM